MIRTILVPIDFTEQSERAARYAVELAEPLGASVTLMHVYSIPVYPIGPEGGTFIESPATVANILTTTQEALEKISRAVQRGGVPIAVRAMDGAPGAAIVELAHKEFDLVVMGTHGRHGLDRLIMGSIAETVVRTASTPILTIRMPDDEQPAARLPERVDEANLHAIL